MPKHAAALQRLPIYLRELNLLLAEGRQNITSQELGWRIGIPSYTIRIDISHFGDFGKQGTGFDTVYLHEQLQQIIEANYEVNNK